MASIPLTTIEPVSGTHADLTVGPDDGTPFASCSGGDAGNGDPGARPSRIAEIALSLQDPNCPSAVGRRLVLEAEVLAVPDADRIPFIDSLAAYVRRNRDSVDPDTLTAVGSAVRKLVMNLRVHELDSIAWVLEAGHQAIVPLEIELELAKSVVWNLSLTPPADADAFPRLAATFAEIARIYVNDRLLPRERYGATALNIVLGLALMRSHNDDVDALLRNVRSKWFTDLAARRADRLCREIRGRIEPDAADAAVCRLRQIADACGTRT